MIPIVPIDDAKPINTQAPLLGQQTLSGLKHPPPLALYIHLPWCARKCPYCDFNSHEIKSAASAAVPEAAYIQALVADLEQAMPLVWGRKVHSVFFGGGTPSLFSAEAIDTILNHVRMLMPLEYAAEITLEANPGSADSAHFAGYRQAGVNRISLGIQSFNDQHLQALGRIHDADQAIKAAELALTLFESVNLDIMYALPGQQLAQALQDANTACQLNPAHLSFYHLTLEPNTPFHRTPPSLPDDDTSAQMQEAIESLLAGHGYIHYETSAFAKADQSCRHNLNYWTFGDYLGIGAGAHSKLSFHDKIIRQSRHKHPKRYMALAASAEAVDQEWIISKDELGFEFMMNALRLTAGFDEALFENRTGLNLMALQKPMAKALAAQLITQEGRTIKPSLQGQRYLNDLLTLFL